MKTQKIVEEIMPRSGKKCCNCKGKILKGQMTVAVKETLSGKDKVLARFCCKSCQEKKEKIKIRIEEDREVARVKRKYWRDW